MKTQMCDASFSFYARLLVVLLLLPGGCSDDRGAKGSPNQGGTDAGLADSGNSDSGGSHAGDSDSGSSGPGEEKTYQDVLGTLCDTLNRCPTAAGEPVAYRDRAECMAIFHHGFTCLPTQTGVRSTLKFGFKELRADLSQEQAAACIQWLETASCGVLENPGVEGPCREAFYKAPERDYRQTVAGLDEPCQADFQCADDFYCTPEKLNRDQGTITCRVCKPRLLQGAPCEAGGKPCQDGLYCASENGAESRCERRHAAGEICLHNTQCQSDFCNHQLESTYGQGRCDAGGKFGDACKKVDLRSTPREHYPCRHGLFCDDNNRCQPLRQVNEACDNAGQCLLFQCDQNAGICGAADGAECNWDGDCSSNVCINNKCGGPPDACMDDKHCAATAYCDGICRAPNCHCTGADCPVGTCKTIDESNGLACSQDTDCDSYFCRLNGTCAPPAQIGSTCRNDTYCYPVGYCSEGTCVERHAPDEECTHFNSCEKPFLCVEGRCQLDHMVCKPASAGQRCADMRVCDDDSYCDLYNNWLCKPRSGLNEPCDIALRDTSCAEGLFCQLDSATSSHLCKTRPQLHEACNGQTCTDGLYCYEGICQAEPVGQSCSRFIDDSCPDSFYCHSISSVCLPRLDKGTRCERHDDNCQNPYICGASNTCEDPPTPDDSCSTSQDCAPNFYCQYSTCQPTLSAGEPCSLNTDCADDLFCGYDSATYTSICKPPLLAGADCSSNDECASGICYQHSFCLASASCTMP